MPTLEKPHFVSIVLLSALLQIAKSIPPCPSDTQFYLAATTSCYASCPWQAPNKYYKHVATNTCELLCPGSYYGFDGNRSCVDPCPSSPIQTYYDTTNKRCVDECPADTFGYIGSVVASNQTCLVDCPTGTFANFQNNLCVTTCPSDAYYMQGSSPKCTLRCPSNYYANPVNKICVAGGACPTTPAKYFSDDTTNLCVQTCPGGYFADSSTGRCLVYCSNLFFGDNSTGVGVCVQNCPGEYYRDNITRSCLRTCPESSYIDAAAGNCTEECPGGTFGDITTKKCVTACPQLYFGDPTVHLCSKTCSYGYFADNFTSQCVLAADCYANTVGDPTTYKCVNATNCPANPYYFANPVAKMCQLKCPNTLWGDRTTKMCLSSCPWSPPSHAYYKNPHTQECVQVCPLSPTLYGDNLTKTCVETCPQPATNPTLFFATFADPVSQTCVEVCPNGFLGQSTDYICISDCESAPDVLYYYQLNQSCLETCPEDYYSDISKQMCVTTCPSVPAYFGYDVNDTCLTHCPEGFFADQLTRLCVQACPESTLQFGDPSTNQCVDVCPMIPDSYGQDLNDGNRTCVEACEEGYFADPLTRTCVHRCPTESGYFGDQDDNRCVLECELGTFADNTTGRCVSTCPRRPKNTFGNPVNKQCVALCPQFLYANNQTMQCVEPAACQTATYADDFSQNCVAVCPISQKTFGDSTSRRCVLACVLNEYADPTTRKCSSSCNTTAKLYKDASTKSCVTTCPATPSLYANPLTMTCSERCTGNYFAYDVSRKCVPICPATPAYYGDYETYRCVARCPRETYIYISSNYRGCMSYCPPRVLSATYSVTLYADNSTWSCVSLCPESENLYNFKHPSISTIRTCVSTCPMVGGVYYFAQNQTQSCVEVCPSASFSTYGDVFTSKCEAECSRDQYRDPLTKRCTYFCSETLFADNSTWSCVQKCPSSTFGETINNTCVKDCPTGFYAENSTWMCRSNCENRWFNFMINFTDSCVRVCPMVPNLYANPDSRTCDFACTGDRFADNNTRKCELAAKCTDGQVAELATKRCTYLCPIEIPSFLENSTNHCVEHCATNTYADNSTMVCVQVCPSFPDFYAYNDTLLDGVCVLFCPPAFYRHTPTRQCLEFCPAPDFFRDTLTMRCVEQCPDYFYADTLNQLCISNCSVIGQYADTRQEYKVCVDAADCPDDMFADPTTYLCVFMCPFGYFSEGKLCKTGCDVGFSDPIALACVPQDECSLGYYGKLPEKKCLKFCEPHFLNYDTNTCEVSCPVSANVSETTYKDLLSYTCMTECLPTFYGDPLTNDCRQTCSAATLFADNSTGRCVGTCPEDPDFYGYNRVCNDYCPLAGWYAENGTRECLQYCPTGSFADENNRRCMDVCTGMQYAHTVPLSNPEENVCVYVCPEDFWGYWGIDDIDNITLVKECRPDCPEGYFAENTTNSCVRECPDGSYADQFLNVCVIDCEPTRSEYADPSTNRCVTRCPEVPSLYAQELGRKCVVVCSGDDVYFRNNETRSCVIGCDAPLYADPVTDFCVFKCTIDNNLYADNETRLCMPTCPNVTDPISGQQVPTYADDSTKRCVLQCPQYPMRYGYNSTNRCVPGCPGGTFGDRDTRLCLDVCFFGRTVGPGGTAKYTYADDTTNFCVEKCPRESYADNRTVICTDLCSEGTYADNSTWRCVSACPVNPVSFAFLPLRVCVYECPPGLYGNEDGRQCNDFCPTAPFYYFRDSLAHRCVKNCTFPFYADTFSQNCTQTCQFGYFENLASLTCSPCPSSCLSCLAALNCTACRPGLYMYDGTCIESCPSFPVAYFANDLSANCVENCEAPYFGFTGTGKCEIECPETYYSNSTSGTCESCPSGCQYCLVTNCSACLDGYIYSQQWGICSQACNSSHPYYLQVSGAEVCSSECVPGTFLLSDLVTCQACASSCLTCSNMGTNCTQCADKFWYNYMCVDTCPDNFYADAQYKCQYCGDQNQYCSLPPLSYTIRTYTKNYRLYAEVIFNREVDMTPPEFVQYIRINTQNGPIKPSEFTASRTTPTTFTIRFTNSSSLNQMSLSIGFAPGFVVDNSGNALTSSTQSVSLQSLTTVDPETEAETQSITKSVDIVSWILIAVVFLMMINYSYPLLVLVDTIQALYMHSYVLVAPLPYMWLKVNTIFGYFHFNFLPKVYTHQNSTEQPYDAFVTDSTFLGNMSPFIFFTAIFFGFFFITLLLLKLFTKLDKCNKLRNKLKALYKSRMRFSFLFEACYYTLTYAVFYALYQFKGYNNKVPSAGMNKGLGIIALLWYLAFFCAVLYISFKTRNKFPGSAPTKYVKNMEKGAAAVVPKKFKFLYMEPSFFPMEIAIRTLLKFCMAFTLMIENAAAQLVLLMTLNLIFLAYILIYKPSMFKVTNRLNIFLSLGFIALEVVLFLFTISSKSSDDQNTTSIACLALEGAMIVSILLWIIYRFLMIVLERCFNYKYQPEGQHVEEKKEKKYYGKLGDKSILEGLEEKQKKKPRNKNANVFDEKSVMKKQMKGNDNNEKQFNFSQLNLEDQEEQDDEVHSVNADQLIKEFAYHFVPQKSEALKNTEKKLLGQKVEKKKLGPIVIEIDEDELMDDSQINRKKKQSSERLGLRQQRTGHLRIEEDIEGDNLEEVELSQISRGEGRANSRQNLRSRSSSGAENEVIWSNLDMESENDSSQN